MAKKKKSRYQLKKEQLARDEANSRRYSTGYRLALYDPINPDAPLVDLSIECDKTYATVTRDDIKTLNLRKRIDFANDCLMAAGARYLVCLIPASLTEVRTESDGRPIIHYADDDDEGEEWKAAGVT